MFQNFQKSYDLKKRVLRVLNFLELKPKVTQTVGSKTGSKTTPKIYKKSQNQNRVPLLREKKGKK